MQDRYTGDIGDFGKYGLLRALTAVGENGDKGDPTPLGVVWYLTPDEARGGDGRHTRYLKPDDRRSRQFLECDEELYLALGEMVAGGDRRVGKVEASGLLPQGTSYHSELLDPRGVTRQRGRQLRELRADTREGWNERALEYTQDCGIIFLDPDNGLETGSIAPGDLRATKYAYYEELRPYLDRKQTLVVYHHLNRSSRSQQQIFRRQRDIYERLGRRAFAMRYHRGSPRAFIIIPQEKHRAEIMERTQGMLKGPWGQHFSLVG